MADFKPPKIHTHKNSLKVRWYVTYQYRHPDTKEFVRFRAWLSTKHKTVEDRLKAILDLKAFYHEKLIKGWSPFQQEDIKYTSLVEAFEYIIKVKKSTSRPRTLQTYQNVFSNFKKWLNSKGLQGVNIESFNSKQAMAFFDYLKVSQGVNNRTYNNHLLQLRTFYNELIQREYTNYNPFKKIPRLPILAPEITPITIDELKLLHDHLTVCNPQLWLACQFLFYCFIRPGELVQIKPQHIDLENKTITILPSISKNKMQQVIVIPDHFFEDLKSYLHNVKKDYFIFSTYLLPGSKQIRSDRISEKFKDECKKIGLNHSFYDLKHTGAGMAVINGVNIQDLKNQLRHKDLTTTNIYLNKFSNIASEDLRKKFPNINTPS
ncbi:MAG: site-specific integrase [Bacteroidia bacterium]|nr:site-specific integrase [Bacteroidia bacterium]